MLPVNVVLRGPGGCVAVGLPRGLRFEQNSLNDTTTLARATLCLPAVRLRCGPPPRRAPGGGAAATATAPDAFLGKTASAERAESCSVCQQGPKHGAVERVQLWECAD